MNARPAKILVADDELGIRQLLRAFLERAEFHIVLAQNGDEAVRLAQEDVPDLIVVDVMMPQMDGYEVCRQLRNDTRTSHVPILMLTSRSAVGDKLIGFESGADDYVTKPFDLTELLARIRSLLRRSREIPVRSPLTGLPGNRLLFEEIRHRLQQKQPMALLYVDLDNFKAVNDAYGFVRGDAAIQLLARLIQEVVREKGRPDDFIGHIGGDDFAIITHPENAEPICMMLCERFGAAVPDLYDPVDRERGYIRGYDRSGVPHRFPLMTISIGGATTRQREYADPDEVSRTAAETKRGAKLRIGNSYNIDRRGGTEMPGKRLERRGRPTAAQISIAGADKDLLELWRLDLERAGYRVRLYAAGRDLLDAVRAAPPTMVVVDALQNDGSAWDLCRALREIETFRHRPILLLSTDAEDEERAFRLQINAFLQKPFSLERFSACIESLVGKPPPASAHNGVQDEDSRSGG